MAGCTAHAAARAPVIETATSRAPPASSCAIAGPGVTLAVIPRVLALLRRAVSEKS
jgi:hypothetical protein